MFTYLHKYIHTVRTYKPVKGYAVEPPLRVWLAIAVRSVIVDAPNYRMPLPPTDTMAQYDMLLIQTALLTDIQKFMCTY